MPDYRSINIKPNSRAVIGALTTNKFSLQFYANTMQEKNLPKLLRVCLAVSLAALIWPECGKGGAYKKQLNCKLSDSLKERRHKWVVCVCCSNLPKVVERNQHEMHKWRQNKKQMRKHWRKMQPKQKLKKLYDTTKNCIARKCAQKEKSKNLFLLYYCTRKSFFFWELCLFDSVRVCFWKKRQSFYFFFNRNFLVLW